MTGSDDSRDEQHEGPSEDPRDAPGDGRDLGAEGEPDEAVAESDRRRASAQGAAGDLARMGIDPRSLGLDVAGGPAGPPPAATRPVPPDDSNVVSLRPGGPPAVPPTPPVEPARTSLPAPRPSARPAEEVDPGTVRSTGTVEALLARTESSKPAPRNAGRLLRTITFGLITPDAAEAAGHERDLVAAVRHRQTERRVVAFVSGKGGVGATSVVCGVGSAYSALRDDRSVVVDVQPGTASLARHLGVAEGVPAAALLGPSGLERTVPHTPGGLGVVDGTAWEQGLRRREITALLDRLGADYAFNLVDVGNDPGEAAYAAVARCDRAVVVASTGAAGTASLEVAMTRLAQANPAALRSAVVVVVCQHDEAYRTAHREVSRRLGAAPARVVVVPPDAALRDGGTFDPARLGSATREAMLEVGAAVALPEERV